MKGIANHIGPEPCAGIREDVGEASAGERAGQPLSRDSHRGKTRGAYPIGAVLVFLHLLEGEIERIGKRLLVHAQEQAARSDSAADLDINWVSHTGAAAVSRSWRGLFGMLPRLRRGSPSHPIPSCVSVTAGRNTVTGRWIAVK
jgi:hypothetical protein